MIVSRWPVISGELRNGAAPRLLFKLPDRSIRIAYSDGTGARYECWSCALQALRLQLGEGPTLFRAPDNFGS